MPVLLAAILASALSSLLGLTGGFLLLWRQGWIVKVEKYFISFAAGAMMAAVFYDILPEAIERHSGQLPAVFAWLLVGFIIFFTIEKYLHWHDHASGEPHTTTEVPRLSKLLIVGDVIHNAIDGIVLGATFLVSTKLGIAATLAVFCHEIPRELGDISVMIATGMKRKLIVWWNIAGALVSPIAAGITVALASDVNKVTLPLLGIAAGSFVYIAASDLVPQISHERKLFNTLGQVVIMVVGVLVIVGAGKLFPGG